MIAIHHADQDGLAFISAQRLACALGDGGPRCISLQAPIVAALAAATVGIDRRVTYFAGHVRGSVIKLPLENETAADSGAQCHADHVPAAARRSAPELSQRCAIGVVIESGFEVHAAGYLVSKRKIFPAKVGSDDDDTFFPIERARRADPDADEVGASGARLRHGLRDDLLDQARDAINHGASATVGQRRRRVHRDLAAAIDGHCTGDDVGAAEIHSDDVTIIGIHTGTGGLRTSVRRPAIYSGASSRMHRQCPSGHFCGPWR